MERISSEAFLSKIQKLAGIIAQEPGSCEQHGDHQIMVFKDGRRSGCPVCFEIECKRNDALAAKEAIRKNAVERMERRLGGAMIPPRFAGKTFDAYHAETSEQQKALASCKRYADRFIENAKAGRCMILIGKTGTGKTHLASAVAHHVICEHNASALYTTVSRICQHVKGSYGKSSDYTEAQAIQLFAEPDLLIVDEVGASHDTEFERMVLFEVINSRYENLQPTILVSNLNSEQFKASIGDRSADRLRENNGFVIRFEWESARKPAE